MISNNIYEGLIDFVKAENEQRSQNKASSITVHFSDIDKKVIDEVSFYDVADGCFLVKTKSHKYYFPIARILLVEVDE